MVLAARNDAAPEARSALAFLCEQYWYPLYAYVRCRGRPPDQAQDLIQEFFTRLLEKHYLNAVDQSKGRFRSFLLVAFKHFLSNEADRARAQKRGGTKRIVSIDRAAAESRFAVEPAHGMTPERLFERRWALTLLDEAMSLLRKEFEDAGKQHIFEHFKNFLVNRPGESDYRQAARKLGMTEGAMKVAMHRFRRRYRDSLRQCVANTLSDPALVVEEIRDLFVALG
jgi:RNA polymerase sigma-70 factor (ECF subfamily)